MLVRSRYLASGLFAALLSCTTYEGLLGPRSSEAIDGSVVDAAAPGPEAGGAGAGGAETGPRDDAAPLAEDVASSDAAADVDADSAASPRCLPPPSQGLITDFRKPCAAADGGASNNACFGLFGTTASGGTFDPYPPPGQGGDSQADSGSACVWYGGQTALYGDVGTGAWVLSGTVGTWAGAGIWMTPCMNAAAFGGIQFTVSGEAGPTGTMTFKVTTIDDFGNAASGGRCTASCAPAAAPLTVTSAPTVVSLRWADLAGGSPVPTIDPSQIVQLDWTFDWPCTGGTPYPVHVTIDDVKLVP